MSQFLSLSAFLCFAGFGAAHADVMLGNLSGSLDNDQSHPNGTTLKAVGFTTPGSAYVLDSVVLRIDELNASNLYLPVLTLDSNASGKPGAVLDTFTSPTPVLGVQNLTLSPTSSFTLQAGQTYWLVLGSTNTTTSSDFQWLGTTAGDYPTGLAVSSEFLRSGDSGQTWGASSTINELQVNVTPVPEARTWALMIAGFAATGAALRRKRRGVLAGCEGGW
jgi:hypothetical protein